MKKVLIIDDDVMMLNALTTLLQDEGLAVMTAADGSHGIMLYKEHRPEVILLDLRLPSITGVEVLREIKRINAGAKVIIITGYSAPEVLEETMRSGAFGFYEKSRDVDELLKLIQNALGEQTV
jgi:DNA-binding NtrC family response regulator